MKQLLLVASVTTAISLANITNAATNGTVNFSGKLNDQTCQVTLNDGSSASGIVVLPTVPKEKLDATLSTAGKTPFTLKLTGCKASTTAFGVTAYFPNNSYSAPTTGVLLNQETGATAAAFVNLQILQKIGTTETAVHIGKPITDTSYKFTTVAANSSSATMNYAVQYINSYSGVTIKPGKVKGIAIYELAYQ
ncbi:type 1 fimbrial protein [Phytobacter diazotrophicus]|uniref:fimbrial protein n=1 Tax=Phytobacter diazotrophicus TaxID=395631 RepID=UPI001C9A07D0|nr:fimbrial protein [Phytobacter diazotrophicus]MBY6255270.1 type 1 fimbrial protein [Phytobacter diazotrophicus]